MQVDKGILFVLSAPSGGGKTSLAAQLITGMANLTRSISHTTRAKRNGEIDGQHYHFVSVTEFTKMLKQDEFLEHALVYGNYYGTNKKSVAQLLNHGHDVVLEIDWQGARQLKAIYRDVVSIFILPPSHEVLSTRLVNRAQDDNETIAYRMLQAKDEILHYDEYDFVIINNDFSLALAELKAIVTSERLRTNRGQHTLKSLVSKLLRD